AGDAALADAAAGDAALADAAAGDAALADAAAGVPVDPGQPGWSWSPAQLRDLARSTAELMTDLLAAAGSGPVTRRPPPELLATWATGRWDDAGVPAAQVLDEFAATVAPYPFGNAHPRFAAWVNSPPHPLGVAASALAAAMNPSVAGGNHAAVHLERQVVRWFTDLLGWGSESAGQLVSGGSAATLTALAAARRRAMTRAGIDDRRDGIGAAADPVVYATAEAHSCATKAVEVLGIGSARISRVATDGGRAMDPGHLRRLLAADQAAGKLPIAVVASAGTVNTGAVDPLGDIAGVCAEHGVWLHVDGAYGAPAVLLLEAWAAARAGLARADSIALDPHKWLYAPVDAGLVLFRDAAIARDTFSLVPPYLRTGGDADEPAWFSEYGLEQTRPFRALKVWMQLRHLGQDGYRRLIARDIAVAGALRSELDRAADFEVLGHGLSVVCFRHLGPARDEAGLDAHNEALLHALQAAGRVFLAGTRVDGRLALRACIVNPAATTADTRAILAEVRRCAPQPPAG
ncbi:MAG TPA: pyridoxal-dependent decarboxylase, partial [Streptosporangiaceae bacterium]